MKKQTTITKILIHTVAAVIAIAVPSPASAAGTLVAFGDFNNDGLVDMAAVTSSTTVTVSLANPDGSYTVSAILSVPSNQNIASIGVGDYNYDGKLDLSANCSAPGGSMYNTHTWLGNGHGVFGSRTTVKWSPKRANGWI